MPPKKIPPFGPRVLAKLMNAELRRITDDTKIYVSPEGHFLFIGDDVYARYIIGDVLSQYRYRPRRKI